MPPARSPRLVRVIPAACLAVVLPLAGCSDSKKSTDAASTPTSVTTTPRTVDTNFTGVGSAEFCQFLKTVTNGLGSAGQSTTGSELAASLQDSVAVLDQAVEAAPPDVKANMVTLADAVKSVVAAMSNAGFDPNKIDLASLSALQSKDFQDAVTRLSAYLTSKCGTGG